MASRLSTLVLLALCYVSGIAAMDEYDLDSRDVDAEENERFLLVLPSGAGNLLNINTTAALLSLLGTAALLSALGFLIYYIVAWKIHSIKGYGGYGGGYGGYGSSYGSGSSYGGSSYGGSNSYGYKRSNENGIDWESLNILDYISMMEEMWNKFDAKDIECQKRVLCEIHQNELQFGPGASKVVNAFGYTKYLSLFSLPGELRGLLDEYREAAEQGRSIKDCGEMYDSCKFSFKDVFTKYIGNKHENNVK